MVSYQRGLHRFSASSPLGDMNEALPHLQCFVSESEVAEDDILRSDVLSAAYLIKRQVRTSQYDNHCIFPVRANLRPCFRDNFMFASTANRSHPNHVRPYCFPSSSFARLA